MQAVLCMGLVISAVIGYLLGGINWAIILTRIFQRKDIRDQGSGNAGMTNVLRSVGKVPALLTFLGDFIKCVIAVLLSQLIVNWMLMSPDVLFSADRAPTGELLRWARYVAGAACVVGHVFPLYYSFKGGKGIVTAAAMIALTDWRVFIAIILTFGILFLWKKIISLGSVACAALYPVYTFLIVFLMDYNRGFCQLWDLIFATGASLFVGVLVLIKHRPNIGRLIRGEEKPIVGKKEEGVMDISFNTQEGLFNFRVAGVFVRSGLLLAMKESDIDHYYLPGGRVRMNETMEEALHREISEELGLGARIIRPLWLCESFFALGDRPVHETAVYFLAELDWDRLPAQEGEFTLPDSDGAEHIYRWLTEDEVRSVRIYPVPMQECWPDLPEELTFFSDVRDRRKL